MFVLLSRAKLSSIHLEEVVWFRRLHASDVMEGRGSDVVSLTLSDETVIFENVLFL